MHLLRDEVFRVHSPRLLAALLWLNLGLKEAFKLHNQLFQVKINAPASCPQSIGSFHLFLPQMMNLFCELQPPRGNEMPLE